MDVVEKLEALLRSADITRVHISADDVRDWVAKQIKSPVS